MDNQDIDVTLSNYSLKFEFALLGLDLEPVFRPYYYDLKQENQEMAELLDWVQKYKACRDRSWMEQEGYDVPPISPRTTSDNAWYRFNEWIQGRPLQQKLKERLSRPYVPRVSEQLSDEEVDQELKLLSALLTEASVGIEMAAELPPRLLYGYLLQALEEEYDIVVYGTLSLDACDGECPTCFQRPWCELGNSICCFEDEEAGAMVLSEDVQKYVSASPVAFKLLQDHEAKMKEVFAEAQQRRENGEPPEPWNFTPTGGRKFPINWFGYDFENEEFFDDDFDDDFGDDFGDDDDFGDFNDGDFGDDDLGDDDFDGDFGILA